MRFNSGIKFPLLFCLLAALPYVYLRWQRIDFPAGPQADENVYLHVAHQYRKTGDFLSNWYYIHRGDLYPTGQFPYRQNLVQPGVPYLIGSWTEGETPLRSARLGYFFLQILYLAVFTFFLYGLCGWPGALSGLLFTGLSFTQVEYGSLVHTETPMALAFYGTLACLALVPGKSAGVGLRWEWGIFAAAGAVAGLGLYFRTNGIFLPLALCIYLAAARKSFPPRAWLAAGVASITVMLPMLIYSHAHFGSLLSSASGDLLWVDSMEHFRSIHAGQLGMSDFLASRGWEGLWFRPLRGAWALLLRLSEMDHGRNLPVLLLGVWGLFALRKNHAVRIFMLAALPTLLVAVWISSYCYADRYLFFLFPVLYGLAGRQAWAWTDRFVPGKSRNIFFVGTLVVLTLPFYHPHKFYQRLIAKEKPAIPEEEELQRVENYLQAQSGSFAVSTSYVRYHWETDVRGTNLPLGISFEAMAQTLHKAMKVRPTHLVLTEGEERGLTEKDGDWLQERQVLKTESLRVYRF